MKTLSVDDQRSARRVLRKMLAGVSGMESEEAASAEEALRACELLHPDLILLDIRLSDDPRDRAGLDVLRQLRAAGNAVPVVMVSSLTDITEIREAMRAGAQDYIFKDELAPELLVPLVESHRDRTTPVRPPVRAEIPEVRERVDSTWGLQSIVGSSVIIDKVRKVITRFAETDATVLIRGETGTGKELVARALHHLSARSQEPFLAVNCSALPGNLIESLMFGHQRGAFTGADRRMRGQFELAGSGTLLLDEIAEMPGDLQAKLLRVLEDRRFRPLGSEIELPLRARVLAATHVDVEQRIHAGLFRRDLYYRLNVLTVRVPSLSERSEDIPGLIKAFSAGCAKQLQWSQDAIASLQRWRWPGNVRELKNLVERLALLSTSDTVTADDLAEHATAAATSFASEVDRIAQSVLALPDTIGPKVRAVERAVIQLAIESCGGNKSAAARKIGLERRALDRRLERLTTDDGSGSDDVD